MLTQAFYALDVPPAPRGAPEYVERLLARLQAATDAGSPRVARECLRDTIGFLSRYFGVVLATSATRMGRPQAEVQGTRQAEQVFAATLTDLLRAVDPLAVALRSVFFREQLSGDYLPYPHTRLLLRDGCLASGSRTLTEWLNSSCEPESDDSCQAEVDSLLPVLSQWLAAAAPFFAECRYDYLVQPRHAFQAVGLRGLEGGTRVPMQRVQLLTRFRDVQTGLPLRTRDMEAAPAQPAALDTAPLAELVRQFLETSQTQTAPAVLQPPVPAAPEPTPVVAAPPVARKGEFDFVMTAAPLAAGAVLLYLLLLAL